MPGMTGKINLREPYLTAVESFLADDWDIGTDDMIEAAMRATEASRLEVIWGMLSTLERIASDSRIPGPLMLIQLAADRLASRREMNSAAALREAISRMNESASPAIKAKNG